MSAGGKDAAHVAGNAARVRVITHAGGEKFGACSWVVLIIIWVLYGPMAVLHGTFDGSGVHVAGTFKGLVIVAVNMGHAVGVVALGNGQVADYHNFACVSGCGDAAGAVIDGNAVYQGTGVAYEVFQLTSSSAAINRAHHCGSIGVGKLDIIFRIGIIRIPRGTLVAGVEGVALFFLDYQVFFQKSFFLLAFRQRLIHPSYQRPVHRSA